MAIQKKLSDLPIKNTPDYSEYVHILDPLDLTDSLQGTDKRVLLPNVKAVLQIRVSASTTILPSWNGAIVIITVFGVVLTVPADLPVISFKVITEPSATCSFAITPPKVWVNGTPTLIPEKSTFLFLVNDVNMNNIYIITSKSIPTLQEVLNNNHNLAFDRNFQGTNAGFGNTGSQINAFGESTCKSNTGNVVNAFGQYTADSNTGNSVNAFGYSASVLNTGNNLNAFGQQSAYGNTGYSVNAFGIDASKYNKGNYINAFGDGSCDGNEGSSVNSFGSYSANGNKKNNVNVFGYNSAIRNQGDNLNAFGQQSAYDNIFNNINVFGEYASADGHCQFVLSKGFSSGVMARISYLNLATSQKYDLPNQSGQLVIAGVDNNTTIALTSSDLNTIYPSATTSFKVYCKNIITGQIIYEKTPSGWCGYMSITP